MTSRIPGFYRLKPHERIDNLLDRGLITEDVANSLKHDNLTLDSASRMVENVVCTFSLPSAIAVNFLINGESVLVPMVVEEPSVVAAASNMARIARAAGGFTVDADRSLMIGQIQLTDLTDRAGCVAQLNLHRDRLIAVGRDIQPTLVARGGGLIDIDVRQVVYDEPGYQREEMVVLHLIGDCVDAMGANMINTLAEGLAPLVEELTGERVGLRILSNLADRRLARANVRIPFDLLDDNGASGAEVASSVAAAWRFAWADPYRAATHNKGVMNGIDAVVLATGNDWRAVEAGAHAWACRDGQYRPVTTWRVHDDHLVGTLELPLQLGVVGGSIGVHPTVRANLDTLGVKTARELAGITAAVGLAQNLGALRALATEGIQRGHMRMHARKAVTHA